MDEIRRKYKEAPVTISLIAICIIVYVISFLLYGVEMNVQEAVQFGAYNPLLVYSNHEYYRLLTANFIHFGIFHIVVNCVSLYNIGVFIEKVLKKKYIVLIFVSALCTSLLPYLLFLINGFGYNTISGGISGVIFGLIGALEALALKYKSVFKDIFKSLAPNLILMLVLSVAVPSISFSGHVSGLIGGFFCTLIILSVKPKNKKEDELIH